MKEVKHVLRNWKEMKGRSLIEKKLNAYLCYSLVGTKDMPHDECYSYAKQIVLMAKNTPLENRRQEIYTILEESFNRGETGLGEQIQSLGNEESISSVADGVEAILAVELPFYAE